MPVVSFRNFQWPTGNFLYKVPNYQCKGNRSINSILRNCLEISGFDEYEDSDPNCSTNQNNNFQAINILHTRKNYMSFHDHRLACKISFRDQKRFLITYPSVLYSHLSIIDK